MNVKAEKGFTLPEVVISVTILAIIAATLSGLIFTALKNRDINREKLEGTSLATSTLDEIKSYQSTWKDIQGLKTWLKADGFTTTDDAVFNKTTTDANNINYALVMTFRDTGISGLFELEASVTSPNNVNAVSIVTRLRGE